MITWRKLDVDVCIARVDFMESYGDDLGPHVEGPDDCVPGIGSIHIGSVVEQSVRELKVMRSNNPWLYSWIIFYYWTTRVVQKIVRHKEQDESVKTQAYRRCGADFRLLLRFRVFYLKIHIQIIIFRLMSSHSDIKDNWELITRTKFIKCWITQKHRDPDKRESQWGWIWPKTWRCVRLAEEIILPFQKNHVMDDDDDDDDDDNDDGDDDESFIRQTKSKASIRMRLVKTVADEKHNTKQTGFANKQVFL